MYYLNDEHSEYEYTVYIRHGTGQPFLCGRIFTSYWNVCNYLRDIAKNHDKYHRIYYIDDPFFNNEYEKNFEGSYYKILRRPVSDWKEIRQQNPIKKLA